MASFGTGPPRVVEKLDGLIGLGNAVGGGEVESAIPSDVEAGADDAAEGVVDEKRRGDAGGGAGGEAAGGGVVGFGFDVICLDGVGGEGGTFGTGVAAEPVLPGFLPAGRGGGAGGDAGPLAAVGVGFVGHELGDDGGAGARGGATVAIFCVDGGRAIGGGDGVGAGGGVVAVGDRTEAGGLLGEGTTGGIIGLGGEQIFNGSGDGAHALGEHVAGGVVGEAGDHGRDGHGGRAAGRAAASGLYDAAGGVVNVSGRDTGFVGVAHFKLADVGGGGGRAVAGNAGDEKTGVVVSKIDERDEHPNCVFPNVGFRADDEGASVAECDGLSGFSVDEVEWIEGEAVFRVVERAGAGGGRAENDGDAAGCIGVLASGEGSGGPRAALIGEGLLHGTGRDDGDGFIAEEGIGRFFPVEFRDSRDGCRIREIVSAGHGGDVRTNSGRVGVARERCGAELIVNAGLHPRRPREPAEGVGSILIAGYFALGEILGNRSGRIGEGAVAGRDLSAWRITVGFPAATGEGNGFNVAVAAGLSVVGVVGKGSRQSGGRTHRFG